MIFFRRFFMIKTIAWHILAVPLQNASIMQMLLSVLILLQNIFLKLVIAILFLFWHWTAWFLEMDSFFKSILIMSELQKKQMLFLMGLLISFLCSHLLIRSVKLWLNRYFQKLSILIHQINWQNTRTSDYSFWNIQYIFRCLMRTIPQIKSAISLLSQGKRLTLSLHAWSMHWSEQKMCSMMSASDCWNGSLWTLKRSSTNFTGRMPAIPLSLDRM